MAVRANVVDGSDSLLKGQNQRPFGPKRGQSAAWSGPSAGAGRNEFLRRQSAVGLRFVNENPERGSGLAATGSFSVLCFFFLSSCVATVDLWRGRFSASLRCCFLPSSCPVV